MINLKKILVISGIKWDDTWQRHQNVVSSLINSGNQVDFISGVKSSKINFLNLNRFFSRFFLKFFYETKSTSRNNKRFQESFREFCFPNLPVVSLFNFVSTYFLSKKINKKYDVVIVYVPSHFTFCLLKRLSYDKVVYDCVRDFNNWQGTSRSIVKYETLGIDSGFFDRIVVDSFYLFEKFKRLHSSVYQLLPSTVNFSSDKILNARIEKLAFFGTVSSHFDVRLLPILEKLSIELLVWGADELQISTRYNFVKYMGYCDNESDLLKQIYSNCDGIVIPYVGNMDGVIPAKLIQSMITGLPIFISNFFDSNILSNSLYVYNDMTELEGMLSCFCPENHRVKQDLCISFAKENISELFDKKILELFM